MVEKYEKKYTSMKEVQANMISKSSEMKEAVNPE